MPPPPCRAFSFVVERHPFHAFGIATRDWWSSALVSTVSSPASTLSSCRWWHSTPAVGAAMFLFPPHCRHRYVTVGVALPFAAALLSRPPRAFGASSLPLACPLPAVFAAYLLVAATSWTAPHPRSSQDPWRCRHHPPAASFFSRVDALPSVSGLLALCAATATFAAPPPAFGVASGDGGISPASVLPARTCFELLPLRLPQSLAPLRRESLPLRRPSLPALSFPT